MSSTKWWSKRSSVERRVVPCSNQQCGARLPGRAGVSVEHGGEFPGQIVRVLKARIQAEAARGRHAMRRIADQKDAPLAKPGSDLSSHRPERRVDDLDGQVGHAYGAADLLGAIRRGEIFTAHAGCGIVAHDAQPARRSVDHGKPDPIGAIINVGGAVGRPGGEVRSKINAGLMRKGCRSFHRDAEPASHAARGPVGGNQVAGIDSGVFSFAH